MPLLSKAFRGRFVAGAPQPRANRKSCDISLMTAAQLVPQSDRAELHQVDVTCADWHVPFVTSVVNTYASWRGEFAAVVCPTARSSKSRELTEVFATERTMRRLRGGRMHPPCEGFGKPLRVSYIRLIFMRFWDFDFGTAIWDCGRCGIMK